MARDNRTLGKFHLMGIPSAPRGIPQIEVTFDIDANGIVNVSAKDMGTGKEQKITITASSGLGDDEINKMVKDAEQHTEEDKKRREEVEVRNQADSLVYNTEKLFNENRDKLPEAEVKTIEGAVQATKDAINTGDTAAIKNKMEELNKASHRLAEVMYQSAQQQQQAQGGASSEASQAESSGGEGDVVDAEFEESK